MTDSDGSLTDLFLFSLEFTGVHTDRDELVWGLDFDWSAMGW